MTKVLLLGPFLKPITGNSFANDTLLQKLNDLKVKTETVNFSYPLGENGKITIDKLLFYSSLYIYLLKVIRNNALYITPGETFFGVVKYSPFIFLAKILKKKIILHIHGDHMWREYQSLNKIKRYIFKTILSKADSGIVLSKKLRRNLSPFLNDRQINVVYNFVEDFILEYVNKDIIENKDNTSLRIIYLSNLIKEKGIIELLNALIILQSKGISFKAKIAGKLQNDIKDEVQNLLEQLKENVTYVGIIKGEAKCNALLESNIFVLPSELLNEAQPISLLEAMATGNVILTTNRTGITDIFEEEKNGYYIKKDPKSIYDRLEKLNQNIIDKNIMIQNYEEAKAKYTTNAFVTKILKVIENEQ